MSESAGPSCPECGKPRAADGHPTCFCARRASDARRETRTAEAAAAEDFDPVRIRPFVAIDADPASAEGDSPTHGDAFSADDQGPQQPYVAGDPGDTFPLAVQDGPLAGEAPPDLPPAVVPQRRRRSRVLLVTRAGAVVAVVVTSAVIGGVFWYESPARNHSVSGGVRPSLPEGAASAGASSSPAPSATSSSASPSATSTPSPSESATAGRPTPTSTPSGTPTATAIGAPAPSASSGRPPVLRFGDKGPEVVELQLRLKQVGFYNGEADGNYDRDVENAVSGYQLTRFIFQDESGVYGAATRASLESETKKP